MAVEPQTSARATRGMAEGHQPANLGDILERVLDRGLVVVGDIRVSLLDIELLTIKLRLLIASVDTARELGIDWWESDPWLTSSARPPVETRRRDALTREATAAVESVAEATAPIAVGDPNRREVDDA